jgi:hypothetical protein
MVQHTLQLERMISVQVFLRSAKPEPQVINALRHLTRMEFESLDFPSADARGFIQFTRYSEGFELGALIVAPSHPQLSVCEWNLVEGLAKLLEIRILLESQVDPATWLMADENGFVKAVEVKYLDDGVDIVQ